MSKIKNPLSRAEKMFNLMMWEHDSGSLDNLQDAIRELAKLEASGSIEPQPLPKTTINTEQASILPFKRKSEDEGTTE